MNALAGSRAACGGGLLAQRTHLGAADASEQVWRDVTTAVHALVGEHNFSRWLAPLTPRWRTNELLLIVPDRATLDCVTRHFLPLLTDELAIAAGRSVPVRLVLPATEPELPLHAPPPTSAHTFESFVTGESNAVAYGAARALAEEQTHAPLFLYGPAGVGKSHLLHAVHHALTAGGTTVACLPAAELVTSLITAYSEQAEPAFWNQLTPLGALLLDDVHSLAGQVQVQEHLVDGLVRWVDDGRVLVLTSDRPPGDVPVLAERLRAQFDAGIVAEIAPPEPALRLAIVQLKARMLGLVLGSDLAQRIATHIRGNVRRLEGALTRLLAHARLADRPIDETLVLEALPELRPRTGPPPTVERVLEETARAFGITVRALRGRSRAAAVVLPRQLAMYVARKLLQLPFAQLAPAFNRGHTTLIHAWNTVDRMLRRDRDLATLASVIEERLRDPEPSATRRSAHRAGHGSRATRSHRR